MKRFFLFLCFVFICNAAFGQYIDIKGKITDSTNSPIVLANVFIKNGQRIAVTNNLGWFECRLTEGFYELVFEHYNYEQLQIKLVVTKKSDTLHVILIEKTESLNTINIVSKKVEMGPEFMRRAIKKRDYWQSKQPNHSVNVYIKAYEEIEDKSKPKTTKNTKIVKNSEVELDPVAIERKKLQAKEDEFLRNRSLLEVSLTKDWAAPNKIKETRNGVKKIGDMTGLFYKNTLEGDFNLYQNLVQIPALNKLPVLSPLANTAILAYKFTYNKSYYDSQIKKRILIISVKPRASANSVFEGFIYLVDSLYAIHKVELFFPKQQLVEFDEFKFTQSYNWLPDSQWVISQNRFDYKSKAGKLNYVAYTVVDYSDYEINKVFPKNYFGMELSTAKLDAYEKDSAYWNQARKIQLNPLETIFSQKQDSIKRAHLSDVYLDSIEKVRNKFNLKRLLFDGIEHYNRRKGIEFYNMPLIFSYQPWWPGGTRIALSQAFNKTYTNKRRIWFIYNGSYGILNKDLLGNITVRTRYNPMKNAYASVTIGRQFDFVNPFAAFLDLARRDNIYKRNQLTFNHTKEYFNGFNAGFTVSYSRRENILNYKFVKNKNLDSLFVNNTALNFAPNNAFYATLHLDYTPFQKFIREPREKIILGSKWPTFFANYKKAVPNIFNSDVDFSTIELGIKQEISWGMLGFSTYRATYGRFLHYKKVSPIDFTYQRRGDQIIFTNPMFAFQTLDSTFNTYGNYFAGHYRHNFEGSLVNKIPFMKFLRLRESVGGSILITPERRNFTFFELYAGADKIIRIRKILFKLGLYYTAGYSNIYTKPITGIKINLEFFDRVKNSW